MDGKGKRGRFTHFNLGLDARGGCSIFRGSGQQRKSTRSRAHLRLPSIVGDMCVTEDVSRHQAKSPAYCPLVAVCGFSSLRSVVTRRSIACDAASHMKELQRARSLSFIMLRHEMTRPTIFNLVENYQSYHYSYKLSHIEVLLCALIQPSTFYKLINNNKHQQYCFLPICSCLIF